MKHTTRKCSKRLLSMLTAIALFFLNVGVASADDVNDIGKIFGWTEPIEITIPDVPAPASYAEVYDRIIAWQDVIPTGTVYDDYFGVNTRYTFNAPINCVTNYTFAGEMAFAFILSDAAFGKLPAKGFGRGFFREEDIEFEAVRVGDILLFIDNGRINYLIVLKTNADGVIGATVNEAGGVVNWERSLSVEEVICSGAMVTRYPEGFASEDDSNNAETGVSANRNLLTAMTIIALVILAVASIPWSKPFKRK